MRWGIWLWIGGAAGSWGGSLTELLPSGIGMEDLGEGELRLWMALFALALVGILALYVSSRKIERLRREQEEVRRRNQEMEERFNELFGRVGANIQKMSKEIVEVTNDVIREVERPELGQKLRKVINTETRILNSTSTLLNFLKLKAGKVTLHRERSDTNRILDDVVGNLMESIESREDVELIFRLDKTLPKEVLVDFGRLVEILSDLLENAIVHSGEGTVLLVAAGGITHPVTVASPQKMVPGDNAPVSWERVDRLIQDQKLRAASELVQVYLDRAHWLPQVVVSFEWFTVNLAAVSINATASALKKQLAFIVNFPFGSMYKVSIKCGAFHVISCPLCIV